MACMIICGQKIKISSLSLGVISVSLSGGLTLLEVDAIYIALKEASIPLIFAFFDAEIEKT